MNQVDPSVRPSNLVFFLALLLVGSIALGIYLQFQILSVQNAMQENAVSRSMLQEELESSNDALFALQRDSANLQRLLAEERTQLDQLQRELAEARLLSEPDFELLKAMALENLQEGVALPGPQTSAESQEVVQQRREEMTELMRDLSGETLRIHAESRFGWFLDELGISGARRDSILDAVVQAALSDDRFVVNLAVGGIAMQSQLASILFSESAANRVLADRLTAEERESMEILSNHQRYEDMHGSVVNQMVRLELTLDMPAIYTIADTYMDMMRDVTRRYSAPGVNINAYHLREVPAVRAALQGRLSPEEMVEANKLLDAREQLMESIERGRASTQRDVSEQ